MDRNQVQMTWLPGDALPFDWVNSRAIPYPLVNVRTGQIPQRPTTVYVLGDDVDLWVYFVCKATKIGHDFYRYKDKVWQGNAVEVFLWNRSDDYLYEFQQSPVGVVRDLLVWNPEDSESEFDDSWQCHGLETWALQRHLQGSLVEWHASFRIPWASLGHRRRDESWRIGLFRIERDPEEYSALRTSSREPVTFHDLQLMAPLILD